MSIIDTISRKWVYVTEIKGQTGTGQAVRVERKTLRN